jgi:uncharacterized membrane protein YciS (DUF1049 family)
MRWVRRLIGVAVVLTVMVGGWRFVGDNAAPVSISYVWGSVELPVWKAVLWCFAAGFALAGIGWLWFGVRSRLLFRRYRKAVGGLEAEIHQLRNLPLAPDGEPPDAIGSDRSHARFGKRGG